MKREFLNFEKPKTEPIEPPTDPTGGKYE